MSRTLREDPYSSSSSDDTSMGEGGDVSEDLSNQAENDED